MKRTHSIPDREMIDSGWHQPEHKSTRMPITCMDVFRSSQIIGACGFFGKDEWQDNRKEIPVVVIKMYNGKGAERFIRMNLNHAEALVTLLTAALNDKQVDRGGNDADS